MIKKSNYLNVIAWFILVVTPYLLQMTNVIDTNKLLISKENGYWSILTGTFLHGDFSHLIGNLIAMMAGTAILYNFYRKMYWPVITLGIIIPSSYMYLSGQPSLGISGLAFALVWFVLFRGLMSRDYVRFLMALALLMFWGGTLKGAIPQGFGSRIAWEAHLAGLGVGFILAVYSRLKRLRIAKK